MTPRWQVLGATAVLVISGVGSVGTAAAHVPRADPPTCDGRPATIYGPSDGQDDPLMGTDGDDVIVVTGDLTAVEGLGGDDLICGGGGEDDIDGGPGDDTIFGGGALLVDDEDGSSYYWYDQIDGGPGSDTIDIGGPGGDVIYDSESTGVDVTMRYGPRGRSATVVTSSGTDTIEPAGILAVRGSPFADHLTGTYVADSLDGGAGDDVIDGGRGDDDLQGGEGDDVVRGGPGDDYLYDGHRVDYAGRDADQLHGGAGDDQLAPETGRDDVQGGPGDDLVKLDLVTDLSRGTVVSGGSGNDVVTRVPVVHGLTLLAGPGHDTVETLFYQPHPHRSRPVVDLRRGRYSASSSRIHTTVEGFEKVVMVQLGILRRPGLVLGTDRAETFVSHLHAPIVVRAGGGDDVLRGSYSDDVLRGGPGHDTAHGRGGDDTCTSVEVRYSC